jgi:glycerol-3-phosphate dehydrogenase subunit C
MASPLTAADLLPLEQYARERAAIRSRMIGYRAARRLHLGPNCTWSFEDRETVRYQVQEMLRTERIFEPSGIAEELAAYNPLIPDGHNLKATLLIEYPDPAERARRLTELKGIEERSWLRVEGYEAVYAIADEDLERSNEEKTSAVHFLRFELTAEMVERLKSGAGLAAGIDLLAYTHTVDRVPEDLRSALLADLG